MKPIDTHSMIVLVVMCYMVVIVAYLHFIATNLERIAIMTAQKIVATGGILIHP